jgi:hypothetical protein
VLDVHNAPFTPGAVEHRLHGIFQWAVHVNDTHGLSGVHRHPDEALSVLRIAESGIKHNLRFSAYSADGNRGTLSGRITSRSEDDPIIPDFPRLGESSPEELIANPLRCRMDSLAVFRRVLVVLSEQRCGLVCVQEVPEPLRIFGEITFGVGLNLRDDRLSHGLFGMVRKRFASLNLH